MFGMVIIYAQRKSVSYRYACVVNGVNILER